jgi:hypothetical protein
MQPVMTPVMRLPTRTVPVATLPRMAGEPIIS